MKKDIAELSVCLLVFAFLIAQCIPLASWSSYVSPTASLPMADDGARGKVPVQTFAPDARRRVALPAHAVTYRMYSSSYWLTCVPSGVADAQFRTMSTATRKGVAVPLPAGQCTGRGIKGNSVLCQDGA